MAWAHLGYVACALQAVPNVALEAGAVALGRPRVGAVRPRAAAAVVLLAGVDGAAAGATVTLVALPAMAGALQQQSIRFFLR